MVKDLKEVLLEDFWIMPATPKYINDGIPYITSRNIKNEKIDFSNVKYISIEDYERISKNRPILIDDILISMIGTLGEVAVVKKSDGIFYGQNMFLVRLNKDKIYQRYFINYFKSNIVKRQLMRKQNKSTQSYLKANHIENLKISIPDTAEQIKIANKLDKVQEIIDIRKKQIDELDELIKSQFVETFENEKYPKKSLIDVCEELFAGGDVNKEHTSKERTDKYKYPIYTNGEKLDGLYGYTDIVRVNKEALTISGRGTIGFSCIRKEPFYPAVRLIVAVPNKDIIETTFLRKFIENKNYGGQGASILQLTVPMIKNELIPIPPIELQNQFADIVKQIDKQKLELQKSLGELKRLQESLMNKYFGG